MKSLQQKSLENKIINPKRDILEVENIFKGLSNHYRIKILISVCNDPGITLDQITELTQGQFKTISAHVKRLVLSHLVSKKYKGKFVQHFPTRLGKDLFKVIKNIQN
jgi:DNA-binding HxlR family transcriptional regulator